MCRILLPDSGRLQEEDAEYINRHKLSKHLPALPLYTEEDAERTLRRLEPLPFEQAADVAGTFQARLLPAGHILGASSVELTAAQITVLFSVDLGPTIDGHASYGQLFPAAGNGPYRFRILVKPPNRATDIEFAISAWSPHRETR